MNCKCYSVLFLMPFLGSFFYSLMTKIFWLFLHSHLLHIVFWSEKVVCKHMCSQTVYAYVISSCNTLCLPSMRPFTILDKSIEKSIEFIPPFYRLITSNCPYVSRRSVILLQNARSQAQFEIAIRGAVKNGSFGWCSPKNDYPHPSCGQITTFWGG